jgi:hypothetical protein
VFEFATAATALIDMAIAERELRSANRHFEALASSDSLRVSPTGEAPTRVSRSSGGAPPIRQRPIAPMMIDVDHF